MEVRNAFPRMEIIVVDDGSNDETFRKAKNFECNLVKVFSMVHSGKGTAIRRAVAEASGDIMVQLDADLQFPVTGIPTLIAPILAGKADIVFGSRYLAPAHIEKGSVSFPKRLASYLISVVVSAICGQRYTDVFAGFKAWKAPVIKNINIQENGFTYESEIAIKARKRGYVIMEVPTSYKHRIKGRSKIKFFYHMFAVPGRIMYLVVTNRKYKKK